MINRPKGILLFGIWIKNADLSKNTDKNVNQLTKMKLEKKKSISYLFHNIEILTYTEKKSC